MSTGDEDEGAEEEDFDEDDDDDEDEEENDNLGLKDGKLLAFLDMNFSDFDFKIYLI